MSSGVTMFFRLLPIFPYSRRTGLPCHVQVVSPDAETSSTTSSPGT
jgi:hypothetical protein